MKKKIKPKRKYDEDKINKWIKTRKTIYIEYQNEMLWISIAFFLVKLFKSLARKEINK